MSGLSRRAVDKQYRPNGFGLSPGLQRARAPYRVRNALTGLLVGSFAVGVWWYSIRAVKQDTFDDVDEEAKALLSARLGDEKAQATAPASIATPSSPSSSNGIVSQSPPTVQTTPATTTNASTPAREGVAGAGDVRGVLARWLVERHPRVLHPGTKTLIWGAPPVDRVGRLGDASEKRT